MKNVQAHVHCSMRCTVCLSLGPIQVRCSGECQGAKAAKERFKRKILRLKEMGKKPNRLDDWRNYSYSCTCQSE